MEGNQKVSYLGNSPTKAVNSSVHTISPNILIYSDNETAVSNLEASLKDILDCDRYTIYSVTQDILKNAAWKGRTALIVIVGDVSQDATLLLEYLLEGGRLLVLHSDFIHTVLPYFKSYFRQDVVPVTFDKRTYKLKHLLLNTNKEESSKYMGHSGYELDVQVMASEDSYNTPSLLKVINVSNHGVAIFSQIYLDIDPSEYLSEEGIENNGACLEIIRSLLGDLGLHLKEQGNIPIDYTPGYFLGNYESKISLIKEWCSGDNLIQKIDDLTIQYYHKGDNSLEKPSKSFLPIYVDENPEHFSTEEYYGNLAARHLGRLIIYSDVISSTMNIVKNALVHGIGAISLRQLLGRGRGGNNWITPLGQAAISLQIWQKISPSLPLIQHAAALAAVLAIRAKPYEDLDIRIKWPNDIYFGRTVKIGGTVTTANCIGDDVFINIGTGVNISNNVPTTCINDIINEYNKKHRTDLTKISIEMFLARYCSELEILLEGLKSDNGIDDFLDNYYKYWLHSAEEIRIKTKDNGEPVHGTIRGVDSAGWLLVQTGEGEVTVAPDGNTFDMMSGLVAPKL